MARLQNIHRKAIVVVGGGLLVGSLLGAHLLTHGGGGGTTAAAQTANPTNGKEGSGPVVLGTADSNPSPIRFGLPPVLQSGEIAVVYVTAGQEVKVRQYRLFGGKIAIGDPLYKFNSRILEAKLEEALRGVDVARANVRKAKELVNQHNLAVEAQKLKIDVAKDTIDRTLQGYQLYEANFRKLHTTETEARIKELLKNDIDFFKLETAYRVAVLEHRREQMILAHLEKTDPNVGVAIAEAEVSRTEAMVDEARTAIDMCTVRTKIAGTIERVNISPSDVMGISSRTPAVILVPAGPRIVRAEIEADFAHRIGRDKIGQDVTVYDNTDPKITYKGKVERIGDTFLQKRGAAESFAPSDTLVIEAIVIVADANPPGLPPLRVGQKVRVNFGK